MNRRAKGRKPGTSAKKKTPKGGRAQTIALEKIRIDGDTQCRQDVNPDRIAEYTERFEAGFMPKVPPTVVYDGSDYWLANGFHTYYAARRAGLGELRCTVVHGTREGAFDVGVACNIDNGEPLSLGDRRKIISTWLTRDPNVSNRLIASRLKVSHHTVEHVREELQGTGQIAQTSERVGKDGRKIDTANIGRSAPPPPELEPAAADPPAEPITTDKAGRTIPSERIAEAFRREHELTEKSSLVTRLKSEVVKALESSDPLFGDITQTQFEVDCNNLRRQFEHARPYAVCPYCAGEGCKVCHRRGWVNETTWKVAPEEMKRPTCAAQTA